MPVYYSIMPGDAEQHPLEREKQKRERRKKAVRHYRHSEQGASRQ